MADNRVLHWTYGPKTPTAEETFDEIDELRSEMAETQEISESK